MIYVKSKSGADHPDFYEILLLVCVKSKSGADPPNFCEISPLVYAKSKSGADSPNYCGISDQEWLGPGGTSSHRRSTSVALGNGIKFDKRKPTRKEVDISSSAQKAGYGTRKINKVVKGGRIELCSRWHGITDVVWQINNCRRQSTA